MAAVGVRADRAARRKIVAGRAAVGRTGEDEFRRVEPAGAGLLAGQRLPTGRVVGRGAAEGLAVARRRDVVPGARVDGILDGDAIQEVFELMALPVLQVDRGSRRGDGRGSKLGTGTGRVG